MRCSNDNTGSPNDRLSPNPMKWWARRMTAEKPLALTDPVA